MVWDVVRAGLWLVAGVALVLLLSGHHGAEGHAGPGRVHVAEP